MNKLWQSPEREVKDDSLIFQFSRLRIWWCQEQEQRDWFRAPLHKKVYVTFYIGSSFKTSLS